MQRPIPFHKNDLKPARSNALMSDETLRAELRRMRANRRAASNNKADKKHFLLIGICLFSLSALYYRYWPTESTATMAVQSVVLPNVESAHLSASAPPRVFHTHTANLPVPGMRPKPKLELPITPCPTEEPLPRAYEPNIYLEQLAGNMNCITSVVKTVAPASDTFYASLNCVVQIPFEVMVSEAQESLNVSVYTNRPENYEKDLPVYEEPLLLEKTGKNQRYTLKAMMNLPPGLYYFVIENKQEKTVAVGKFKVG